MKKIKLLSLFITLLFSFTINASAQGGVSSADYNALVDLYNSTNGANWTIHTNWLTAAPVSSWYGIGVSNGRVTNINLPTNNLVGGIPTSIGNLSKLQYLVLSYNKLSGSIPNEIGNLSALIELHLYFNNLSGNLPNSLGNLNNLKVLAPNNNQLTGTIPNSIWSLINLTFLGLGANGFTGTIPTSVGNLTNLESLALSDNQFSGSIPSEIGNLTKLTELDLFNNQFSGVLPNTIGNLTNLTLLASNNNKFTGTIPSSIWNLTKLTLLGLGTNLFTGTISPSIGNLTNLQNLALSDNQLTGSIPSEIGVLTNLTELDLFSNQLTGTIPNSFSNLTKLKSLALADNQLTGILPSFIWNFTNLTYLGLGNNQFTGSISTSVSNLTNLQYLRLFGNQFSGNLPSSIGNLSKLTELLLFNNLLSGSIPSSLVNLKKLVTLRLDSNLFNYAGMEQIAPLPISNKIYFPQEQIPLTQTDNKISFSVGGTPTNNTYKWYKDNITNLVATKTSDSTFTPIVSGKYFAMATNAVATALTLYSDTITVLIPSITSFSPSVGTTGTTITIKGSTFANATSVSFGGIAASSFSVINDSTLTAIVAAGASGSIAITNNNGTGSITGFTYQTPFQTDSLALVDLYNSTNGANWTNHTNWLTAAPVSSWFGVRVSNGRVTNLDLPSNNLVGSIPTSIGNITQLTYLDMQQSKLLGNIPTTIGNLTNLTTLGLADNQLTGNIPTSIGNLTNLTSLFLHINQFSGTIPNTLGNLVNLQTLWLSQNNLSGSIPAEIWNLHNLKILNIKSNQLNGTISSSIGGLINLTGLDLSGNSFSGTIPSSITNLVNLNTLSLGLNNLTGSIPSSISNLSQLTTLDFDQNQLSGTIPTSISNLGNLSHLDLHSNSLSGSIPSSIGSLIKLTVLGLSENQFTGTVPNSFTNLTSLNTLFIKNNNLSFSGIEAIAQTSISTKSYSPQAQIPLTQTGNKLSISVGGTPSHNTYKWYNGSTANLVTTIVGDSTYTPTTSGQYFVVATNSVATALTLFSDTIAISVSPSLTSFTPTTAPTGTTITIKGNSFTNAIAVSFGGTAASSFTVVNDTVITAVVGSGASGSVAVTNSAGVGSLAGFGYQVYLVPSISTMLPNSGPIGTLVTIKGQHLKTSLDTVIIGGINSIIIANNDTSIVAMVMPNTKTGNIEIRTAGGIANNNSIFTVTPTIYPSVQKGLKLIAGNDAIGQVHFGASGKGVAISADGNTAIIGGYPDDNQTGAAWIFTRNNGVWTQQGNKLVGSGAVGKAQQGSSVAINADGNTVLIGGQSDSSGVGAVWVFTRSNGVWTQQGKKLVGSGWQGSASLQGAAVSLSADGNTALIGGFYDNNYQGTGRGAAWIFTRNDGNWKQQGSKLVVNDNIGPASFGEFVSLSADGNTAICGGSTDNNNTGAAWVFIRNNGQWSQQGNKLIVNGITSPGGNQLSIGAVALNADGNTAIIGGIYDNNYLGASWIFTRTNGIWTQQGNKLVGTGSVQNPYVFQGGSVALSADGNIALSGANGDNNSVGAAWLFIRSGNSWSQPIGKLVGSGYVGSPNQAGVCISSDGSTALISGSQDNNNQGAVWVFEAQISPSITSFTPTTAPTGTTITIKGTSFTNATAVSFGGVAASSFTVVNDSVITAVVGSGASGSASLTTSGGTATLAGFTYCTLVTPSVSIASSTNNVCTGTSVTFTATPTNGGTSPTYNFKVNGISMQTGSSATYTSSSFVDGDVVTCVLTANNTCQTASTASSASFTMNINSNTTPSVSIATASTTVTTGTSVTFNATPTNGGVNPSFQWKKNNVNVGGNSITYSDATLVNGDVIKCVLTSNVACATNTTATSNSITITINTPIPNYTWTGITSTDWYDANNWTNNLSPNATSNVNIPLVTNQPKIASGTTSVAGITVANGVTITNNATLHINGDITNNGILTGSGVYDISGAGTATISGIGIISNLSLNNAGTTIASGINMVNLTGVLKVNTSLATNDNLTLKSTSAGTAVVAPVAGSITGRVNIERYIPLGYAAFRDLGVCVLGAGSIANTWGQSLNDYKAFNYTSAGWSAQLPNTTSLQPYNGYRVLVTGFKNPTAPFGNVSYMNSPVTLSYSGTLLTGDQNVPLNAGVGKMSFVCNPYASQVDVSALSFSGLYNGYWYLDPTNMYGGYENYNYFGIDLGASNLYSGTSASRYLQPGQAFFVCSNSTSPSLIFTESAKNNNNRQLGIFGTTKSLNRIATGLFTGGKNLDGAVVVFNNNFSNAVAKEDGLKISNHGENLTFKEAGKDLCANGRLLPIATDELQMHLYNLKTNTAYLLKLDASQFDGNGLSAYLKDKATNKQILIAGDSNTVSFTTANDTASYTSRYSIVFGKNTLPISNINVTATKLQGNQVAIKWNVISGGNSSSYQVEHSTDGTNFSGLATVNSTATNSYTYTDAIAAEGVNFYRIKATDKLGIVSYSKTVQLTIDNSKLIVSPNPITNGRFKLGLSRIGYYMVSVIDKLGKTVYTTRVNHTLLSSLESISIGKQLAAGIYTVKASDAYGKTLTSEIIIK